MNRVYGDLHMQHELVVAALPGPDFDTVVCTLCDDCMKQFNANFDLFQGLFPTKKLMTQQLFRIISHEPTAPQINRMLRLPVHKLHDKVRDALLNLFLIAPPEPG